MQLVHQIGSTSFHTRISKIKAPKILPWIAHKNGITDELALNLWRRAAGEAKDLSGCCDSSDYHRLAVSRLIGLADEEGKCAQRDLLARLPIIPGVRWMLREQNRLGQANLLATQKACRFWLSHLKYLFSGPKTGHLNIRHPEADGFGIRQFMARIAAW